MLDLQAVQHSLESDLAHKESAISIDSMCRQLNNHSRGVNYYGGIEKIDKTICDAELWQRVTNSRLVESQSEREKSSQLKTDTNALIENVSKSVWECFSQTNNAFRIRVIEMTETRNKVQMNLQKIQEEILAVKKVIVLIVDGIVTRSDTLKVAQTRLQARNHRSGMELCNDEAQKRLFTEVDDINGSIKALHNQFQATEGQHQQLLKTRANLETDLQNKTESLFIDNEKCLGLRRSFPVDKSIKYSSQISSQINVNFKLK